jgi:hypothetical protein
MEKLSHEQSLTLISEMIDRARNNIRVKGALSLIFWGYVVAVLSIVQCVLINTLDDMMQSSFVWLAMIPAGVVSYFIERRIQRETLVKTHIDSIVAAIWAGFFIGFVVFSVVIHSVVFREGLFDIYLFLMIPIMLIMLGTGQFVAACAFRSKIWYAFAACNWIGAIACIFLPVDMQFIVFAVCMIVGFAIPGHVLNRQSKKRHV